MRRMAILRGLLRRFDAAIWLAVLGIVLACLPVAHAQSVTAIDGSQTNLVIVGLNNSTSGGWILWRSKFIPEHIIFAYELPAGFTAVNPQVWCTLDDQSQNPNDTSKWFPLTYSVPANTSGGLSTFDSNGIGVGTAGNPGIAIVETGVYPCVAWAIAPAGINIRFNGTGNSKVTAVQLPSSGDASFLGSTGGVTPAVTSGGPRVGTPSTPSTSVNTNDFSSQALKTTDPTAVMFCQNVTAPIISHPCSAAEYYLFGGPSFGGPLAVPSRGGIQSFLTGIAATTTQIVAASGSTVPRVLSFSFSNTNATATTVSIVTGTGTNCGTGTATIFPPVTLTANTGSAPNFSMTFPPNQWLQGTSGQAICITSSAAGSVNAMVTSQQD